jgi:tetratricopeptide (TPR) repeat protein/tRNA A-37 threonylcarbamoyl transferase component Bud32
MRGEALKDDVTVVPGRAEVTNEEHLRDPDPGPLPRGATVGRYVIVDAIGAGAMGRVYAGYDPKLDRKVAIKLLRMQASDETAVARLQREAQAMARLSHRNVVSIHDVGDHEGQVFLAMEFVQGRTVGAWSRERERDWSEIVDVYVAAGEGLAAAHTAGLVHRDFKPDNVMVADDGRVLVMDFGLARSSTESPRDEAESISGDRAAISAELTAAGSLVGTPAYMSPEQFDQAEVGPQSDQFSFCASMYEALWSARPFEADSLPGLAIAVRNGRVRPIPPRSGAPKWLAAIVLRGLSVEPSARHRSMRELLSALDRGRRRGRGRIYVGGVALVVLAGTGVAIAATSERRRCRAGTEKIAEVWNTDRSDRIAAAYAELELPYASATWARATPLLDAFADEWAQAYYDACAATRIHGEQSGARLDARMDCLAVERAHVDSLLTEFETPDAKLVERTVSAANKLPQPSDCADTEKLDDVEEDPQRRELALQARSAYAESNARLAAGRYDAALESAEHGLSLVADAELPDIAAELFVKLSAARRGRGDFRGAEQATRDGLAAAARSKDYALVAELWLDLLYEVAIQGDGAQQGPLLADAAEVAVIAAGDPPKLRWSYEDKKAMLLRKLGDLEEAELHHRRAIEIAEQANARAVSMSVLYSNFGTTLHYLGKYREAREMHERTLAEDIEIFGEEHPTTASTYNSIARACMDLGDDDCALGSYERALSIQAATLGEDHPEYADSLFNLSVFRYERMMFDEADAGAQQAMEIWKHAHGEESERMAVAWGLLGTIARARKQPEVSVEHQAKSEAIMRKVFGDEHPRVAQTMSNRALALLDLARYDEALAVQKEALRIREATHGPDHPDVAYTLCGTAEVLVAMGRAKEAVPLAERAVALREKIEVTPGVMAVAYYIAAQARWEANDDRERAIELAQKAYRAHGKATTGDPDRQADIAKWLEERGASPPLVVE